MAPAKAIIVNPSAYRLMTSMRDIGYEPATAMADLVDNSVSAGARTIEIVIHYAGSYSKIAILDDGAGMRPSELDEALRFGSRTSYSSTDLGRFGLGLKTASLSLGRKLSVVTRSSTERARLHARILDLDRIAETDRWEIEDGSDSSARKFAEPWLATSTGTVVLIEELDRVLPDKPESGWAKRRLDNLEGTVSQYLGMVFHQFLESSSDDQLKIMVNGTKVQPWNPFAPHESATKALDTKLLEVAVGEDAALVTCRTYVLPPRSEFSSPQAFEELGGPKRWNRQQGLYIYRAGRMIQSGGWSGIRSLDEHTKLARVELHFGTELDELFKIDVAKMKVSLPSQLRRSMERVVNEVCVEADTVYRHGARSAPTPSEDSDEPTATGGGSVDRRIAMALAVAASEAGEFEALERIMQRVRTSHSDIAVRLGW